MVLFDSHAHYDDKRYDMDRDEILTGMPAMGVGYILNAASGIESAQKSVELAHKYDYIYAAAGIHPHEAARAPEGFDAVLEGFFSDKKVVAVGEIGLDYHYDFSPRDVQKDVLTKQLALAVKVKKPIIIHDREAHRDILDLIKPCANVLNSGVFHLFSGSVEMAREVLDMGFYLSFGGAVTFKNARKPIEVISYMPLDRLLLETDCPYMTPEPYRGKRNDSSYIILVAEKVARIRNMTVTEIAEITANNAKRLFNISE